MDCLVTKLKSVVNNHALPKIGELRLFCESANSANTLTNGVKLSVKPGATITVESVDGTECVAEVLNQTNTTLPETYVSRLTLANNTSEDAEKYFVFKNTNCEVRVLEKYNITKLRIFNSSESIVKNWGLKDISQIKNSSIIDGYSMGIKTQGVLSFSSKENTPLTSLRFGIMSQSQQSSNVDIDTLPLNLPTINLIHTESTGDVKNYFTSDRDTITDFKVNYTKIKGDIADIIKWMSVKGIYDKIIGVSNYITIGNLLTSNEDVKLISDDNGASYDVKRVNIVVATYTIATETWTYPQ